MNVGIIQQSNSADLNKNLEISCKQIESVATDGAELVVLQELHRSLYFCQVESQQYFDLAEPLDGPTVAKLSELAKNNKLVIVGSIFEKRLDGIYHNTAVVLDTDGSLAGYYRKMHIPDDPGYYEKYYFTPGDLGFKPITSSLGKLGILICWDQWFPEAARLMALAGAELLIYPTAIGWDPSDSQAEQERQLDAWMTIQRSHAIANNLPVIAVNRTGFENDPSQQTDGIQFWGSSFICDAMGKIIAQCSPDNDETLIVSVDRQQTEQQRLLWPYLRDRRVDAYEDINKRCIDKL